jgi:Phosphotransferase enzyme family
MGVRQDRFVLDVPRSLSELTPEWMTAALARRCPGAIVRRVEIGDIADGTNRRARVRLSFAQGSGPESVFVKAHARVLHRLALVALRALSAEARLADSGIVLPAQHPALYAGGFDARRLATIVVMEDVAAADGRPNDASAPLSVSEVRNGLAELARLHAAFWARPLPPPLAFVRPWRLGRVWAPVSVANLWHGLRRLASLGHSGLLPSGVDAPTLERQFRYSAARAARGPQTLLHGDPHPGNTYALPGKRTGFYDWQLVRTGHYAHDVGYFLAGSVDVDDRRAHEEELLRGYLDELGRGGVDAPTFERAWVEYRGTPAFGLATWLHTLSVGSFQPVGVCLATVRRFAAAYEDLGTRQWGDRDAEGLP